ncbi:hypothetical protein [Enterococcus dongliensis]|uniref:Uncharacterized protein n=1 Tax=Enterococcus dongliensis TaxID=2559925 RepID=A0ABU3EQS2_9ENTE|nr:hypothetical protein [Enterococcus dongliensis]MDT2597047.1 hypothetical protein [Enterococcus dongliensis]
MRYDTKVLFIKNGEGSHYDPDLGEWIEDEPTVTVTDVNVTDLGTERSVKVFGDVREGAKVIRTMPLFSLPEFDHIEIDGKTFKETTARNPSGRHSLIVQEVASNG